MFNLCATSKLLKRLKIAPGNSATTTTRLGDWYGNLLSVGRQHFAMFTNQASLLTVVMPEKEIDPAPVALIDRVRCLLVELKVPLALIEDEMGRMQACAVTATASRSVLGSMNDFGFAVKLYLSESPPLPLHELQHRLAETPMKALGYRFPREAALDLLSRGDTIK